MSLLIALLSIFTGRAIWFEKAAKQAEQVGDKAAAVEFRNAAFRERLKHR
jgi:hypothetical protein